MTQVTFEGNLTPSEANLDANFTELYARTKIFIGSGTTLLTTTIPVNGITTSNGGGGALVILKGAGSVSGVAFVRTYLVAIRVLGGGTPDVAQTLIASAGEAGEVFTFGSTGSFVTVTGSGTTPGAYSVWFIGA